MILQLYSVCAIVTSPVIIIIIMARMAVFLRGWLPHRGKAQMACNYCFPTRTNVLNKFRILKKRHVQMRNLTSHLVG